MAHKAPKTVQQSPGVKRWRQNRRQGDDVITYIVTTWARTVQDR